MELASSTIACFIIFLFYVDISNSLVPMLDIRLGRIEKYSDQLKNDYTKKTNGLTHYLSLQDVVDINLLEDAELDFNGVVEKYGHTSEEHTIVSEDGYITKLFNIPGDRTRPVFLLHGIFDASNAFVVRGNDSMGISLANAGYDVWLGNMRGNTHSRKHETLDPDLDDDYWDFSYHEMALYDLPPTIDYILGQTGQEQIYAIAHSLGNNIFYAMMSMLPEYNEKIRILIALAPAVYIQNIKLPTRLIVPFLPIINQVLQGIGKEEIVGNSSAVKDLLKTICPIGALGYVVCAELIYFTIVGRDESELERDFLPVVLNYYPSGSSRKNFYHLAQSAKDKRFARYDAGTSENLQLYGSEVSPVYNLTAVNMPVAIFTGQNDKLVVEEDTERLRSELPNVVEYTILEREEVNHIDFVWGRTARSYLFPFIFDLLEKY